MLDAAGFEVVVDEIRTLTLDAPLDEPTRRFAHRLLERTQVQLQDHADPADLAALDVLIQPGGGDIRDRDDARLVARRHLYVARAS
jgi:hypothetical protein